MHKDPGNQFRPLLADDPPAFLDTLKSPWDQVPDLEEYNHLAYQRIVRALQEVARSKVSEEGSNTQALLLLGEAGAGKTHLLTRVARNLSKSHQILFVRKPNNEDAVAQHVWANIVESLTRSLPDSGTKRSQLDNMLAHVFTAVLVPEFERDIKANNDAERKQRWVRILRSDPFNLFNMLGKTEKKRQEAIDHIRNRTLRFLQVAHPGVEQRIARVLITYCFVQQEYRKRLLLTWLSGQDVNEEEANTLGLPASWVKIDETSSDAVIRQQREEQALRAIRTIGILSTHYQPLILAFDQLEGMDEKRLTQRWGDTVREIFTMAPNFLIVTCMRKSYWDSWFGKELDQAAAERIAQRTVTLETFGPQHGLKLLASRLAPAFAGRIRRDHLPCP